MDSSSENIILLECPVSVLIEPFAEPDERITAASEEITSNGEVSASPLSEKYEECIKEESALDEGSDSDTNHSDTSDLNKKIYPCDYCGKVFGYSNHLKNHVMIHTGEKPFSCDKCGKCFSRRYHLQSHTLSHVGIRRFACTECSRAFLRHNELKLHMRIHTGEKPYKCSICYKDFARSAGLKYHIRIHTGEKPILCPTCGKGFAHPSEQRTHMLSHTTDKPEACQECGKLYRSAFSLKLHSKHHQVKDIDISVVRSKNDNHSPRETRVKVPTVTNNKIIKKLED